jgi:hypothetical protein
MTTPSIPWHVFFKALRMQKSTIVHAWLRYWIFSDDGAALLPRRKDDWAESLSLEKRQKIAALFLETRRKRRKTLH